MRFRKVVLLLGMAGLVPSCSAHGQTPQGAISYTIDSAAIAASGARRLSDLLQARVPGLSVFRPNGSAAQSATLRLRGVRSIALASDPIVFVDGVRVDALQDATLIDAGVRASRLDDVAPDEIARIDVLPGAAAASQYGPGAAGGVLLITTKRGAPGSHVDARARSSLGMIATSFPANYQLDGTVTSTSQPTRCPLSLAASGGCTPTQLSTWNPLERASPFRIARSAGGQLALSGGNSETTGRVGITGDRMLGLTSDDDDGRVSVRAGVHRLVSRMLELGVSGGYLRSSAALSPRGGSVDKANVVGNGLFGSAMNDSLQGYRHADYLTTIRERVTHTTLGASMRWQAPSWLQLDAVYGRDQLLEHDDQLSLLGAAPGPLTFAQLAEYDHALTSVRVSAEASYHLFGSTATAGSTTVGYQSLKSVLGASDTVRMGSGARFFRVAATGPVFRQQVTWNDRVAIGIGAHQQHVTVGSALPSHWFKSGDVAWLLGPTLRVDSLRLRAAYGEASGWSPGDAHSVNAPQPSFPQDELHSPGERTAESEIGIDFIAARQTRVSLTAFRADASHLWLGPAQFQGPPGVPSPRDVGAVRNQGIEAMSTVRLLEQGAVRWDATLLLTVLRNRVTSLGDLGPLINPLDMTSVGQPVASYYRRGSYTYADSNHDGLLAQSELQASAFPNRPAGSALPTREVSLSSNVTMGHHLTLFGLVDYRGGQKLSNGNEVLRCARGNCRAMNDPTTPLADQAQALLGFDPYVQDGSFVKLREISLRWTVPDRLGSFLGSGAGVTIAGRNLATWTRYKGLDPELNDEPLRAITRVDLAETPIPRELLIRLEVAR